jgi:hypothetical protein
LMKLSCRDRAQAAYEAGLVQPGRNH